MVLQKEGMIIKHSMCKQAENIALHILTERFSHDSLLALATVEKTTPHVRTVNAYYEDGAFYVITNARSGKMQQLKKNSTVALSGDWFTAHGKGVNLGWFCKEENRVIAEKLREVFASWIDNGHNDFSDENTCILRIDLTDAVLYADGIRYVIDFRSDKEKTNTYD